MAVLTREQYFDRIHNIFGDDASEDTISFIEDMTDTYNELDSRANSDAENWKQRYIENDEAWKKKYKARFFSGTASNTPETVVVDPDEDTKPAEDITIDDLFRSDEE